MLGPAKTPPLDLESAHKRFRELLLGPGCEQCGRKEDVALEGTRTMYHFEGEPGSKDDPNRPLRLCRTCAKDYHEYWDDMWNAYRSGLL